MLKIILDFDAPDENAASIIPLFTSENDASASLAKKATEATESGTTTASGPIFVPTIIFDKGRNRIINIRNGTERIMFSTNPIIFLTVSFL